jgi:hypothetical protein
LSLDPKQLQELLGELKASPISRKTAWDILQALRGILEDHGVVLAPSRLDRRRQVWLPAGVPGEARVDDGGCFLEASRAVDMNAKIMADWKVTMLFLQSAAWLGGWQRRERRKQQRGGDRVKQGAPIYPEPGFCGEWAAEFSRRFQTRLKKPRDRGPRKSAVNLRDF